MNAKKRGLGRGLDALLGSGTPVPGAGSPVRLDAGLSVQDSLSGSRDGLVRLPVEFIHRSRFQPRREFRPETLQNLADSIRAQGIMQPLVVRPLDGARDAYELIAGERRWRASQMIGLESVPCLVREVSDQAALAMALVENLQREDLGPIEEALAMQRLREEFDLTHDAIAEAVGKSRVAVTNILRLLRLESDVRALLENGAIEMGHARALLAVEGAAQVTLARDVAERQLNVRQTETLVRKYLEGGQSGRGPHAGRKASRDADVVRLEERISERLGMPARLEQSRGGAGRLVIRYTSLEELDGVLEQMLAGEAEK